MSSNWQMTSGQRWTNISADTSDSGVDEITAGAADTKGSYGELIDSTAEITQGMWLSFFNPSGTANGLLDIAVGAAASEEIIIPNIYVAPQSAQGQSISAWFPIMVPESTRLAARWQTAGGSTTISVGCVLLSTGLNHPQGLSKCFSYGHDTSDSGGVTITASSTANVKGSYTEITSGTSEEWKGFYLCVSTTSGGTSHTNRVLLDLAVGASDSEENILENILMRMPVMPGIFGPIWMPIPASTRLSARIQCSTASRTVDVTVLGIV